MKFIPRRQIHAEGLNWKSLDTSCWKIYEDIQILQITKGLLLKFSLFQGSVGICLVVSGMFVGSALTDRFSKSPQNFFTQLCVASDGDRRCDDFLKGNLRGPNLHSNRGKLVFKCNTPYSEYGLLKNPVLRSKPHLLFSRVLQALGRFIYNSQYEKTLKV